MLKYKLENEESGEVREWYSESNEHERTHRTLRSLVKNDLKLFPYSELKITVTGDDEELVKKCQAKAEGYIEKAYKKVGQ